MATAMFIFGTLGLFVRHISLDSGELALYRAILAVGLIGIWLIITKNKISILQIKRELPLLFVSGAAMGINWILLFQSYKYTTVSMATLSYYFAPVLVTLICPLFFHEKTTVGQKLCFLMSTIGLVLIIGTGGISGNRQNIIGILFGLGAAVFYATVIVLNKYIKNVTGLHRTFLQFIAAIVVLLPYVLITSGIHVTALDGKGWVNLLLVGLIHTGITYCLYFSALKDLPGQETAILSYIDPLVAVAVSVLILGEYMSFWQAAGGALILGFTLWNEWKENSNDIVGK